MRAVASDKPRSRMAVVFVRNADRQCCLASVLRYSVRKKSSDRKFHGSSFDDTLGIGIMESGVGQILQGT